LEIGSMPPVARAIALRQSGTLADGIFVSAMWHFIVSTAVIPTDRDLLIAVVDDEGVHAIDLACRWREGLWIDAKTGRKIDVNPTHWRQYEIGS
jgi:hypothetical protein